jgi:hypothetical protein
MNLHRVLISSERVARSLIGFPALLVLSVLFLTTFTAHAQSITRDSIFKEGAIWTNEYHLSFGACSSCIHEEKGGKSFVLMHDTIDNGVLYKIVHLKLKGSYGFVRSFGQQQTTSFAYGEGGSSFLGYLRMSGDSIFFTNKSWNNNSNLFYSYYPFDTEKFLYIFDSLVWNTGSAQPLLKTVPMWKTANSYLMCYDNGTGIAWKNGQSHISLQANLIASCIDMSVYLGVSTLNATAEDFEIYPNPFTGNTIPVSVKDIKRVHSINIYDMQGKLKRTFDTNLLTSQPLNVDLAAGMYIVTLVYKDGTKVKRKFLRL